MSSLTGRITKNAKDFFKFLKATYVAWDRNDPFAKSAIIAYYTLFSLPSLLMIVTTIASTFIGAEAVQGRIHDEIARFISPDVAKSIEEIIVSMLLAYGDKLTTWHWIEIKLINHFNLLTRFESKYLYKSFLFLNLDINWFS